MKMKFFTPQFSPILHASAANSLHTVLEQEIWIGANARSSHWRFSVKKCVLSNFAKYTGTPAPEETPVNFTKFLRRLFLQTNSRQLHLKCRHCKSKAREIDCLCCREEDAMFIASAKIPASCYPAQVLGASARLLVTCGSFMYLVDEFFFCFWVQLNKTRSG